ncbi:hypothetical protein [Paenibacillus piscarius]|uniref:hypothetical protein n=1 Tax=Paenibacillus piscarius TaxID=1089681 RepID=UPI001EE7DF7F|nr:hypothetical protein [Paenibacillus piscarius]
MNKKKGSATIAVLLCAGGLFAISAVAVPNLVNSAVVAKDSTAAPQQDVILSLPESAVPVLKVEAPVPVSTVEDYLRKNMNQEQMDQIYDSLSKAPEPTVVGGHDETEAELNLRTKRHWVLEDQYVYDGIRPQKPMPFEAGQGDLYLDPKTNTLYVPDRTWTDEELLQLIDWNYRQAYAASLRFPEKPVPPQKYSESEFIMRAAESVRKLYDADVSKLEISTSLQQPGFGFPPQQWVYFSPYKERTMRGQGLEVWKYNVIIDPETGVVVDTTAVNLSAIRTPIDGAAAAAIQKDDRWIKEATRIVKDKQGEQRKIVKAYLTDTEVNNKRGMVAVDVLLEDGSKYNAELRYPSMMLRCLIYEPAHKGK